MIQSVDQIEKTIADIEAIKQLKALYAMACDDNYNPKEVSSLFAENAVWDGGEFGRFEGRSAIRDYFSTVPELVKWAVHYISNPVIEVRGDSATGRWYLWQPMVLREDSEAVLLGAHYHDEYVKTGGRWLHQNLRLDVKFFAPYEHGFGKTQFLPVPA